jgi:hypothetical protein
LEGGVKTVVLGKVENGGVLGNARTAPVKRERRGRKRMIESTKNKLNSCIEIQVHQKILYSLKYLKLVTLATIPRRLNEARTEK